ncbi:MAG: DUF72 domain-containing protein [candidate division KSB1 bacterium]|nr:DUF72 domain-containing protein [candidate division KSB1 bacterium]
MLKIGCCGFSEARSKYFCEFKVVEVQQTFYQPPRLETLEQWRNEAPPEFEFTLKAWQLITHPATSPTYRRLKKPNSISNPANYGFFKATDEVFAAWEETRRCANALNAKLVIFQCPASFKPTDENIENMEKFFLEIDRPGLTLCWEPRGQWENKIIASLCERLNLVHCVDPFVTEPVSGSIYYFRLHGIGGYRYRFSTQDFERLTVYHLSDKPIYYMFNNVAMLEDARSFLKFIANRDAEAATSQLQGAQLIQI